MFTNDNAPNILLILIKGITLKPNSSMKNKKAPVPKKNKSIRMFNLKKEIF
jgi:hypothetical protein